MTASEDALRPNRGFTLTENRGRAQLHCLCVMIALRRVGVLSPRGRPNSLESDFQDAALPRDLRELGYVEGKNLIIEWRFADGKYEQFPVPAAELAQLKMDVSITAGPTAIGAAQKASIRRQRTGYRQ